MRSARVICVVYICHSFCRILSASRFFNVKLFFLLDLLMFEVHNLGRVKEQYGANVSLCKISVTISKNSVSPSGANHCFYNFVKHRVECLPMVQEIWVQSQVASYQRR